MTFGPRRLHNAIKLIFFCSELPQWKAAVALLCKKVVVNDCNLRVDCKIVS